MESRVPVPVQEVSALKALLAGLVAFVLVAQAVAAAMQDTPANASTATHKARVTTLEERLELKLASARRYRGAVRFFRTHRELSSADASRTDAVAALTYAEYRLAQVTRTIAALRASLRERETRRRAPLPPRAAICEVFKRYCQEAIAVARCESHLTTTARNGQYLGLFQMGSYERRLFGHGRTAHEQAAAAHRYFVRSGRDWSPWSCRWAAA